MFTVQDEPLPEFVNFPFPIRKEQFRKIISCQVSCSDNNLYSLQHNSISYPRANPTCHIYFSDHGNTEIIFFCIEILPRISVRMVQQSRTNCDLKKIKNKKYILSLLTSSVSSKKRLVTTICLTWIPLAFCTKRKYIKLCA